MINSIYRICMYCWTGVAAVWVYLSIKLGIFILFLMAVCCLLVSYLFWYAAEKVK